MENSHLDHRGYIIIDKLDPERLGRVSKKAKTEKPKVESDLEENSNNDCIICFEEFTASGPHRICCLACGHVFGQECIMRHLSYKKSCPICGVKAKHSEVRILFFQGKTLTDTSEVDRAKELLEQERKRRLLIEREKIDMEIELHSKLENLGRETRQLKLEIDIQNQAIEQLKRSKNVPEIGNLAFKYPNNLAAVSVSNTLASINVTDGRVIEISEGRHGGSYLYASSRSGPEPGSQFGVVRVSLTDTRYRQFFPLHSNAIRDVKISKTGNEYLLSTGFDMKLSVFDVNSARNVLSWNLPRNGWSCCWNEQEAWTAYVGLEDGSICMYDLRNTQQMIWNLNDFKPAGRGVHSMAHMSCSSMPQGVLLFGRIGDPNMFDLAFLNDQAGEDIDVCNYICGMDSVSLSYCIGDSRDKVIVLASKRGELSSHHLHSIDLCDIIGNFEPFGIKTITTYKNQMSLVRSGLWRDSNGKIYVASGTEGSNNVLVWDAEEGGSDAPAYQLDPHPDTVFDVKGYQSLVASISRTNLRISKLPI